MIYAFRPVGQSGPIKIGSSNQPAGRIASMSSWAPMELEMVFVVDGGLLLEKKVHFHLRQHRLHGEWFAPDDEVLSFVDEVVSTRSIPRYVSEYKGPIPPSAFDMERYEDMAQKRRDGWTLQRIGDEYGISRERVRQIIKTSEGGPLARTMILAAREAASRSIARKLDALDIVPSNFCLMAGVNPSVWSRWHEGAGHMSSKTIAKLESKLDELESGGAVGSSAGTNGTRPSN